MPASSNGRFRGYPARMSERQQLALLLQMTSQDMVSGGNRSDTAGTQNTSRSTLQRSNSKSRWSNRNGNAPMHMSINRKNDFCVRQILNTYKSNSKQSTAEIIGTTSTDESSSDPNTPSSLSDTATTAPFIEQHDNRQQQDRPSESRPSTTPSIAEDSGAPCEMRRTPPQSKVDRSGTKQSGSSPRVTLRLNQVRSARDEKRGSGNSRQGISVQNQSQMDASSKTSTASSGSNSSSTGQSNSGNQSTDNGDVYEFKSSKEATPVRGANSPPNINSDKEKDSKPLVGTGNISTATGNISANSTETTVQNSEEGTVSTSPSSSSKRSFDGDVIEDQDDENRRKKRKDSEAPKDNAKSASSGRQTTGRNNVAQEKLEKVSSPVTSSFVEQCAKSGKQGSNATLGKNNQNSTTTNADRKSPSSSATSGSSPKPSSNVGNTQSNSKTASTAATITTNTTTTPSTTTTVTTTTTTTITNTSTPAPPESDGEDDRSKSSDSSSAPKVPPLKIVIPQSTTSEQEQGSRNGKNTSNRSHQLPYVVASSNSNDSTDKDQSQSASGTTSPMEGSNTTTKTEEKKDFTGALHSEERSTHHQRVLRSSHRTGSGGNGPVSSKETVGGSTGNGNYSNSSPLPATSSNDRSNNSSPQQRHHSPTPETTASEPNKTVSTESTTSSTKSTTSSTEKLEKNAEGNGKNPKDGGENSESTSSSASTAASNVSTSAPTVELHPRKRKMKTNKEAQQAAATAAANEAAEAVNTGPEVHPHDQPITNCYQLFLNIRKQIERRRKGLFPVQPKPPQGFKDYLMNRCTYVLAGNANKEPNVNPPVNLAVPMKDLYIDQEKERYRLRMQHVVEKEKLVLSVEQEILRVHGRAARALANQSLPFSVCTILKDEEVYNVITPEQEEKDRNARSRYNGRLFLSWLQDVDDKWEKIKEAMLLRHHNEAESLHAVQRMDWEWKLKEVGLCEFKARPQIDDLHVPMVHVSDDFDLLPA
ncbi:uncharacterized protein LOC107267582 [Cephus cinctus]|uniref:Uncharacterized protein LOC107267582 n=1 Tax=Cephus cinctus TaxID=211228 RepID=A0AAJ7BVS3_CEPCN|nr:uncharacterized protein LOC107267582 [Cephus cinctus]